MNLLYRLGIVSGTFTAFHIVIRHQHWAHVKVESDKMLYSINAYVMLCSLQGIPKIIPL